MLEYVVVLALALVSAVLFIPNDWSGRFGDSSSQGRSERVLSRRELSLYDGQGGSRGTYLAILGQVFDVSKGHQHYGAGGAYHSLAGKDASLAFVSGDFTERGLTDDVSALSPLQVLVLYDWLAFYQREYQSVGVVIGRFYSEGGRPTEALLQVEAALAEGRRLKATSEAQTLRFPACNSEWSSARGGRVWCTKNSGGTVRGWTGVPRRLFSPDSAGVRCVCVQDSPASQKNPNLQKYERCPPHAHSCTVDSF